MAAQLAQQERVLLAQRRQRQVPALLQRVLEHRLQLRAMAGEFAQGGGAFIQRGLRLGGGLPAKLREQSRIDAIGLGAEGAGFGEVPDAGRLDHRHRDAGFMERGHKGLLITAGGFTDDQHRF